MNVKRETRMIRGTIYTVTVKHGVIVIDQHQYTHRYVIAKVTDGDLFTVEMVSPLGTIRVNIGNLYYEDDQFKFLDVYGKRIENPDLLEVIRNIPEFDLIYNLDPDSASVMFNRK